MNSAPLLIEIGVEEFPVPMLDIFYTQAVGNVKRLLQSRRLDFKEVLAEATPRRLVFFVEALSARQREERTVLIGPPQDKAYDSEGKPTPALEGFLKSRQASLKDLQVKETPRGRYVALEKIRKGESTLKLLPGLVAEILSSLSFPKMMRWEKTGFRFPRPLRWVVVLYGGKNLSFSLAGVKTGRKSYGHRFLAPDSLILRRADGGEYQKKLKARHVILSLKEREGLIRKGLEKKFHQKDIDPDLIHETAQLVEEPFLLQGRFSETFRDLPEEVLATCMKKYQKIFSCRDAKGKLLNRFVAILNGKRGGLVRIREDYENILISRLRDAQYFYDEDTKEPLEKKVERLKGLVFLGRLGNMRERVERLEQLVKELAQETHQLPLAPSLERVARLSKADLVTHMVGEFPELQGIVGREFALEAGEPAEVARAIGEQYLPKNLAEEHNLVAKKLSPLGALFGIADRIDLLVGAFGTRLDPTGSEDPYALRRAGGVFVKLVRAFSFHFSLPALVRKSYETFKVKLELSEDVLHAKLEEFLKDRMAFELQAKPGNKSCEILQGVMKSSFEDLADVFERYDSLSQIFQDEPKVFLKASKVVERTSNILKGAKEALSVVNPSLFQEPLEKELFELLRNKTPDFQSSFEKKDYKTVTRLYGETFFDPLHHFFDRVMVNVADPQIRKNRQALMHDINILYTAGVADLSLLTPVRE